MKRVHAAVATLAFVAGCRAVLGIEPLEVVDGGSETDGGVAKDSAPSADTSAPNQCADSGANCNMCCRSGSGMAEHLLEQYAIEAGCVCGAGPCAMECASGMFCTGQGSPTPTSCGQCVGTALATPSPPCQASQGICAANPACDPVLECLKGCPQ